MNKKDKLTSKLDPRCPKCGAQFAAGATFRKRLPVGFGFATNDKFQIDVIEIWGYKGFCLGPKCKYEGEVEYKRQHKTLHPASINRKLAKIRTQEHKT